MTLSPALAAQLDKFTDPRQRLLAEAQQLLLDVGALGDHLADMLAHIEATINGDKTRDDDEYADSGAADADRLAELLREVSILVGQMAELEP